MNRSAGIGKEAFGGEGASYDEIDPCSRNAQEFNNGI